MELTELLWLQKAEWPDLELFLQTFAAKLSDFVYSDVFKDRAQGYLEAVVHMIHLYMNQSYIGSTSRLLANIDSLLENEFTNEEYAQIMGEAIVSAQDAVLENKQ